MARRAFISLQGGGFTVSGGSSLTMAAGETAGVMIYNDWQPEHRRHQPGRQREPEPVAADQRPLSGAHHLPETRHQFARPSPTLTISGGTQRQPWRGTIYAAYGKVSAELSGRHETTGRPDRRRHASRLRWCHRQYRFGHPTRRPNAHTRTGGVTQQGERPA